MKNWIIVRGGGDMATASIHKLVRCGFPVLVLETPNPTAIRRAVAFSQAVFSQEHCVEQVTAQLVPEPSQVQSVLAQGKVPVLIDPLAQSIELFQPAVVLDGILAKKNLGTHMNMAPLTIALGPGFEASVDVDFVVETQRGHDLGRSISQGFAEKNTGIPGTIQGVDKERVLYASASGNLHLHKDIGDLVSQGEIIANIQKNQEITPVYASISGVLRGILPQGFQVHQGLKLADIDPREQEQKNCFTISDKARCIAGTVLELVLCHGNK